jgi:hypothetical protein
MMFYIDEAVDAEMYSGGGQIHVHNPACYLNS